ncbi:serralysin-like metalloprotease [Synechococcus sp. BOUM118]|nr:serralysin-like metalloprotease [Synechococcus sp. BOUM118]
METITKKPAEWQYKVMREAMERVNREFDITLNEVEYEQLSDTQIKLTTVPNSDAVNGEWIRSWDNSGVADIYLSMTYQSGLDGSKYPDAHENPDKYTHDEWEKSEWKKIFIHELGHLLGLEHPWDKDDGDWAVDGPDVETEKTIMGYESRDASGKVMDWFQDVDQRALKQIWGASTANPEPTPAPVSTATPEPEPATEPEPEPNDVIIKSFRGKGKLKGTKVADAFTFDSFEAFTKQSADKIIGFNASQGDTIAVGPDAFPSLQGVSDISFASTKSKKEFKQMSREDYDFVYFEKRGRLYFDGNGVEKNWGNSSEGGLVAILKGKPELTAEDITLLA